jgi:hypothetical protein
MNYDTSSVQSCFNKVKLKNKEGIWGKLIEGQRGKIDLFVQLILLNGTQPNYGCQHINLTKGIN